jgi:hypothetical protein
MRFKTKSTASQSFLLFCLFQLVFCLGLEAQEKINAVGNYDRISLTLCLYNDNNQPYMSLVNSSFDAVKINDKYNNHNINHPYIIDKSSLANIFSDGQPNAFEHILNQRRMGKEIIAKWFSQKQDGTFSMQLIAERGLYNATDSEYKIAQSSKRGSRALEDAGERLISKSYLVVLDFNQIETWKEYYDRIDARNFEMARRNKTRPSYVSRTYTGFRGSVNAFLYKVAWNDSLANTFYEKAWNDPTFFNRMDFPVKFVSQIYLEGLSGAEINGQRILSDKQLMTLLEQNGIELSLVEIARQIEDFKVKSTIYQTHPIRAKVGLKEDVKIDQLFLIYENRQDKKLNNYAKLIGSIRATKEIADNRTNAEGLTKPTRFFQEAGSKIFPGMKMVQQYDYGFSFSFGWGYRAVQGPIARLDFNLARIVNISLFRLYLEGQFGIKPVKFGSNTTQYTATNLNIEMGLSKEFCVLKNIHLEPFFGFQYNVTSANLSTSDKRALRKALPTYKLDSAYATLGVDLGIRMPINIKYNIQLVPSISLSALTFSSNSSLFGSTLRQEAATVFNSNTLDNSKANLNGQPIKWDILLRFKF